MCIRSICIHSVNRNSSEFVCLQNQESQQSFRISLVLFVMPEKLPKETIPTSSVFSFPILSSFCYDAHKKRKWGCLIKKIFASSSLLQLNIVSSQYFKTEANCLSYYERLFCIHSYISAVTKSLAIHKYSDNQPSSWFMWNRRIMSSLFRFVTFICHYHIHFYL